MSSRTRIAVIALGLLLVIGACVGALLWWGSTLFLLARTSSAPSLAYFSTVAEVLEQPAGSGGQLRVSGAVEGSTIQFEEDSLQLRFVIVDVPADYAQVEEQGGIAEVLDRAVSDPNRKRLQIVFTGPKPELLRDRAQAIIIGRLAEDGVFYADEILLKCPTRYEEALPEQAVDRP
jgi:cytochrome c-type biogenesis protein CcmE